MFLNNCTSNRFWSTKFVYKNKILQKITWEQSMKLKCQISAEQIYQIYGPLRCPIFKFFEKLIPYRSIEQVIEFYFFISKLNFLDGPITLINIANLVRIGHRSRGSKGDKAASLKPNLLQANWQKQRNPCTKIKVLRGKFWVLSAAVHTFKLTVSFKLVRFEKHLCNSKI